VYCPANLFEETITVKNMKLLILGFGALGVVAMLMEFEIFKLMLTHLFDGGGAGLIWIGAFVVPVIMGIMALSKPPLQAWQAGVSLLAFGVFAFKISIWELLPHIMDMPLFMKMTLIADVGGIVVSIGALAKPERA
jgi:hypothetical protein